MVTGLLCPDVVFPEVAELGQLDLVLCQFLCSLDVYAHGRGSVFIQFVVINYGLCQPLEVADVLAVLLGQHLKRRVQFVVSLLPLHR